MHGGIRTGSGRKNSWASGTRKEDCKLIRVPEYIAEEILTIAHYIDAGEVVKYGQLEKVAESNNTQLERVTQLIEVYKSKSHPTSERWKLVNKLIAELEKELRIAD